MDDPDRQRVYDVNIVATYDTDIIPYLDAPSGRRSSGIRKPENPCPLP